MNNKETKKMFDELCKEKPLYEVGSLYATRKTGHAMCTGIEREKQLDPYTMLMHHVPGLEKRTGNVLRYNVEFLGGDGKKFKIFLEWDGDTWRIIREKNFSRMIRYEEIPYYIKSSPTKKKQLTKKVADIIERWTMRVVLRHWDRMGARGAKAYLQAYGNNISDEKLENLANYADGMKCKDFADYLRAQKKGK